VLFNCSLKWLTKQRVNGMTKSLLYKWISLKVVRNLMENKLIPFRLLIAFKFPPPPPKLFHNWPQILYRIFSSSLFLCVLQLPFSLSLCICLIVLLSLPLCLCLTVLSLYPKLKHSFFTLVFFSFLCVSICLPLSFSAFLSNCPIQSLSDALSFSDTHKHTQRH